MSSSQTLKSTTPRTRQKKKSLNHNPQISENDTLSSPTPKKTETFSRRVRNSNVALSIGDIRKAAGKGFTQKVQTDQIDSWADETPKKKRAARPEKLPEKYEILGEFFNGLDTSIRLLRLRGLKSSFTNICPQIECLTDRRFTCGHLAQLKFIVPEVIEIKKVLVKDERTSCLKPDLHVSINVNALESEGKSKSDGGGSMHLRKAFRKRLEDISKSHTEDYEIPEATLPHPFNGTMQNVQSGTVVELPLSSSPSEVLTDVQTVEQTVASTSCSIEERNTSASSCDKVPVTPTKAIDLIVNDDLLATKSASIQSTPAKLASTPARLMAETPALQPPKRCAMSPDDDSTSSPNKLVRGPPRSRSLKFDTPVKNKLVEDEVPDTAGTSIDKDILDILSKDLVLSLREKEKKAIEERDPAISQAKRRRQIISSLPKLFNMVHFLFQSMNRSVITKEELVHKLIWTNFDIVDSKEVEEQLNLLLELVPDWISEKKLASDLLMIHINQMSNPQSIRARLEEAK